MAQRKSILSPKKKHAKRNCNFYFIGNHRTLFHLNHSNSFKVILLTCCWPLICTCSAYTGYAIIQQNAFFLLLRYRTCNDIKSKFDTFHHGLRNVVYDFAGETHTHTHTPVIKQSYFGVSELCDKHGPNKVATKFRESQTFFY